MIKLSHRVTLYGGNEKQDRNHFFLEKVQSLDQKVPCMRACKLGKKDHGLKLYILKGRRLKGKALKIVMAQIISKTEFIHSFTIKIIGENNTYKKLPVVLIP